MPDLIPRTMDILDKLDFEAVASPDDPWVFYGKGSPRPTQLLDKLEIGARDGDLAMVKDLFSQLRNSNASQAVLSWPGSSLHLAIKHRQEIIVRYLLDEGVEVGCSHIKLATEMRAKSIVQLLLKYGWDINTPLSWFEPPILA